MKGYAPRIALRKRLKIIQKWSKRRMGILGSFALLSFYQTTEYKFYVSKTTVKK